MMRATVIAAIKGYLVDDDEEEDEDEDGDFMDEGQAAGLLHQHHHSNPTMSSDVDPNMQLDIMSAIGAFELIMGRRKLK